MPNAKTASNQGHGIGKAEGVIEERQKRTESREDKKKQRKELWKLTPMQFDNTLETSDDLKIPSPFATSSTYDGGGVAQIGRSGSFGNDNSVLSSVRSSRSSILSSMNPISASDSCSSVVSKESKMSAKMVSVFLKDAANAVELVRSDSRMDSDPAIEMRRSDTLSSSSIDIIAHQQEKRATLSCTDGTLVDPSRSRQSHSTQSPDAFLSTSAETANQK